MAQLVLGLAGAVIGGATGIPYGAQIGWMAGAMLGQSFQPTQNINEYGPRLGDARITGASYGEVLPYLVGTPRVAGKILWASTRREVITTTTQGGGGGGKGGGGGGVSVTTTTYTYYQDVLFGVSENEYGHIRRIWRNGELVWVNPTQTADSAGANAHWGWMQAYPGGPSQMPDPTYEAAVGTANAPAYRGRGTVFIGNILLGSSGELGNFEFEVSIGGGAAGLPDTVEKLLLRCGMNAGQFDVMELNTPINPPGEGEILVMSISQICSTRSVLEALARCYFFDCVLSDKLYFRGRGVGDDATIPFAILGVSDKTEQNDPLPLRQTNDLEVPSKVAFTYANVSSAYQNDTEYADRIVSEQGNTFPLSVPLGFTPTTAKYVAELILLDKTVTSLTTTFALGEEYAALEPSDVVVVTDEDDSTYRFRLTRKKESNGVLMFDAEACSDEFFAKVGVSSDGPAPQTEVTPIADTMLRILDAPLLRDQDDAPGLYYAVQAGTGRWLGAALYESRDNVDFYLLNSINSQSVLGTCMTTLGDWTDGDVIDETNTVTVEVLGGELSSVTRANLLAGRTINVAMIGSEIIQFQNALLVATSTYKLSGLYRGIRGTEWAKGTHGASESFTLLGISGIGRISAQAADLGKTRYYKAITAGQTLDDVSSVSANFGGVNLKPFSPVDVRANRTTTDTVLTWQRRTRLSTRLNGSLPMYAPLDEPTEAYEIVIYADGTFTTEKRTLTSTTATVTYTLSEQTTDFGSGQSVLYIEVFQMSESIGRGYAARATV